MEVEPVDSTCIAAAGYDEATKELEIHFTDGTIYIYEQVFFGHYYNMLKGNSPGWYFNRYIRNNHTWYQ